MAEKHCKEKSIMTVGEAQEKALNAGPQGCYDRLQEFCSDIEQLTKAMNTLFEQDPAVLLVLGVSVKVEVSSKELGTLFAANIGSKIGEKVADD